MFVLEEAKSRKRPRSSQKPEDLEPEPEPIAKKQKSYSESRAQPRHRPPSYWDTLSKIRLTRGALREFDRRNIEEKVQPPCTLTPKVEYPVGRARLRLKRLARRGGPDLSHLRGLANLSPPILERMTDSANSQSRKRSSASSRPSDCTRTTSTKITPYSGNFEQKLIDNGIYPNLYEHPDGHPSQKPANLSDIQAAQRVPRGSLSPSRFTDEHFEAFQRVDARASGETTEMFNVLPFIAGDEATHRFEMGLPLNNLKPFDKDLSDPMPDVYHGAAPSAIHPRVRADLGPYIIPSKADSSRPAAPNFFVEGKSAHGRPIVAKRQVLIDGAIGARAIHELQNYKAEEPRYDNKARSFSATYQNGHLQTYATHITAPLTPGGAPEYHMTQTKAFALTSDKETFVKGATAYRNDRDLAKTERDRAIAHANQVARQMPAPSPNRTSRSTVVVADSDTSEDELVRDEVTPIKRPRPSAALPGSYTRNSVDKSSIERSPKLSKQSQNTEDSGQRRQSRPMTEVSSKRMRYKDEAGWRIQHQGESSL